MKKTVIILVTTWFILLLTSCYFYGAGKAYGQLVDIHIYDLDGQLIEGSFIAEYCLYEECQSQITTHELSHKQLNAPAPEYLYFVTHVEPNESYIIELVIKVGLNYTFKQIDFGIITYDIDDLYHHRIDGRYEYISIKIDDVNEDNQSFRLNHLVVHKTDDEGNYLEKTGSFNQTGRTYIYGVFFKFLET